MGASKSSLFTQKQNEVADLARALAHPARVAIIEYLLRVNACIGGQIVDELPLAQPTISRHLKELKAVGLIKGTVEGNRVSYCIDAERWALVRNTFRAFFAPQPEDWECC